MATYTYKHYTYSKKYPCATWYMEVTESDINTSNNTSKITVKFYVKATHNKTRSDTYNNYPAGYGSSTPYSRFYVDGVRMKEVKPANFDCRYNSAKKVANGTKYNLGTYTQTITHNSDGAKSVTITCTHWTSVSPKEVKLTTGKMALTKINRYRTTYLGVPGGTHNIGNNITITGNTCSTSLTHALNVSLDNTNWTNIKNGLKFSPANSAAKYTFTIPNSFKNSVGKQKTATMYVKLSTWDNGKYIGVETKTVTIKNNDAIAPALRKSYLTLPSGRPNIGSSMTVQVNPCNTSVGHYLWASIDNKNWIKVKDIFYLSKANSNNSVSFTVPNDFIKDTPAKSEKTMWVWLSSYHNGTKLGDENKTITIYNNYAKYSGSFTLSDKMYKLNGRYIFGKDTRIVTDLKLKYDYVPRTLSYTITGPNGYKYSTYFNPVNDWAGQQDKYLGWPDIPGSTGYHTFTSPAVPYKGTYTITVLAEDGRANNDGSRVYKESLSVTFEEEYKFLSIQDSYIDTSLARDMVNGKYYKNKSRLGIKIKIKNTHTLSSMNVKIGSNNYNLKSYMYNNASYTCPDKLTQSGSVTVQLTIKDTNGLTDTKVMYVNVDEEKDPPSVPKIEFEHKSDKYTPLSEGEKIIFTGSSEDINDYQIIYALASCNVFKATSTYTSKNSYNDASPSDMHSKLHSNISSNIRYYIYKDFGQNNRPITQDSSNKKKFHLHPTSPNHTTNDKYYALQWFEYAKPGDMVFIYVRERVKKTLDNNYLYSDSYKYNDIPKSKLFAMCVIPPCPGQIEIRKLEQTNEKFTIVYPNPIYNLSLGDKNPIHLIDVCLIAKDSNGNILNKSSSKRRDGMNGKTFFYYSERKWHSIVPLSLSTVNNVKEFTMSFDISKYPKGTSISIIAFYYTDYYMHPSIYSTSNILVTQRQPFDFELSFVSPANNAIVTDPNPTINLKVTAKKIMGGSLAESPIYENVNFATNWNKSIWDSTPVWFRCPRSKDSQLPRFKKGDVYTNNNYYTAKDYPNHKVEHYNSQKSIYSGTFKPTNGVKTKGSLYKENCLFLQSEKNLVDLGDIMTNDLTNSGTKIYTWKQDAGKFLKYGLNTIEAYTCPYNYEQCLFSVEEKNGYWLTDTIFISNSIMPYNYYRDSIIRPSNISSWADVESEILFIEIPYKYLNANNKYSITFTSNVNNGFEYDDPDKTYNILSHQDSDDPDKSQVCKAYMFINLHDENTLKLKNVSYTKNNIVYRPKYTISDTGKTIQSINNYNKNIKHTITFTAPNNIASMNDSEKFILEIRARGIDKLKLSKLKLNNLSTSSNEDLTSKRLIDMNTKENKISINVNLSSSNLSYGYINPLNYDDQMALRDYLLGIASQYNISVKPGWRNLKRDSSYLQARDFNDVKSYCYNLFSAIKNSHSNIFKGNPDLFKNLPTIASGNDKRGPENYSSRGKHYFPEWDDLIDIIKKQTFSSSSPGSGGGTTTPTTYYNITYYLVGGVASDTRQQVEKGKSFYTTVTTTQSTLSFTSASVTMGGTNVSSSCLTITKSKVTISIPSVTGDIHIDARTANDSESTPTPTTYYNITYYLVGGVASDTRQQVEKGKSFYTTVTTTQSTLSFTSASITMGGTNVSSKYLTITKSKVTINIPSVTGDIHIDARTANDSGTTPTPTPTPTTYYNITYYLVGGVASSTIQKVEKGKSYNTTVTLTQSTLHFISASVTMGGINISDSCLTITKSKVTINIPSVTGNIHIDARTSDSWPITYNCGGYISFSNKQTQAKHKSLFETYIYWNTEPSTFIVTMNGVNITNIIDTYPNMNAYFISISQVTGPVVIKVW